MPNVNFNKTSLLFAPLVKVEMFVLASGVAGGVASNFSGVAVATPGHPLLAPLGVGE